MQLIRGRHNLRPEHRGCVATIGNFDGVHLGHQAILSLLRRKAAETGLPSLVVVNPGPGGQLRARGQPRARGNGKGQALTGL